MLKDPAFTNDRSLSARTVAFSGDLALHLDERQYQAGTGPRMDAVMSDTTITVDTSTSDYPEFCAAARHRGIAHVMSLGLPFYGSTVQVTPMT